MKVEDRRSRIEDRRSGIEDRGSGDDAIFYLRSSILDLLSSTLGGL